MGAYLVAPFCPKQNQADPSCEKKTKWGAIIFSKMMVTAPFLLHLLSLSLSQQSGQFVSLCSAALSSVVTDIIPTTASYNGIDVDILGPPSSPPRLRLHQHDIGMCYNSERRQQQQWWHLASFCACPVQEHRIGPNQMSRRAKGPKGQLRATSLHGDNLRYLQERRSRYQV